MKLNSVLSPLLAFLFLSATATADLITGLTVASGTTNLWNAVPMGPAKAINGEGLPGGVPALSGTHTANYDNGWWSLYFEPIDPAQITINLGANYDVDTIHVWNYNEGGSTGRSTKNVEIYVSPDGDIANLVKLVTGGTGLHDNGSGNFLLPQGPGSDAYTGFDLDLSGVTNASLLDNVRLIQIKPLDSYGGAAGVPNDVGLAEVQFGGTAKLITGLTLVSGTSNPWNAVPMGPAKAINGEGLPGGLPALSGTHTATYTNGWWSFGFEPFVPAQITINLGANYDVDTIHVWNYNEGGVTGRSTKNAEIYVSPDGDIANLVKLVTGGTGLHDNGSGNFLLPQGPGSDAYTGFNLDLSGVTNASLLDNVRLIQIKPLDSYGGAAGVPNDVGLAEVQFGGKLAPGASAPQLIITPNGANYDFSWASKNGKLYDLVTSTDLSTPIRNWPVHGGHQDIVGTAPTNTLSNVVPDGARRFFALIEKNAPLP